MMFRIVVGLVSLAEVLPAYSQVVINEIHYDPDVKTEAVEFIELFNAGSNTVNLTNWRLTDAVDFTFPGSASLPAGGYLVVAGNPAAVQTKFSVTALGPWSGTLANEGETIVLRNAAGVIEDEVEYQPGFPWPTVGDPPGYSIELANPAFDNNPGGNWRASVAGNPAQQNQVLVPNHAVWKYLKGLDEASQPTTQWRALTFDDAAWASGAASIGYGENFISTVLDDMRSRYTTVFFRKTFVVNDPSAITSLVLEAQYDDGIKVWINGANVLNANMPTSEVPAGGSATSAIENLNYVTFNLASPQGYLQPGTNVIAIQGANSSLSSSTDFFVDARLLAQTGPSGRGPTPGRMNSVFTTNLPPQIRQVDHSPNEPRSGEAVTITAKVTDPEGVASVTLRYQVVSPGNYIELTDAAYTNNWTSVAMNDAGINRDAQAGDSVFTAVIPAPVQQHRSLVRYRLTATDGTGLGVMVPYPDDPQPNFAYFCYDGVPAWQAAVQPGWTPVITFPAEVMQRLPVVHLIARNSAVEDATWFSRYGGDLYRWAGTLVYDGKVYDHIHYRARGGVWRYAMVKNMWKFDFNRGHDFQMRDDYGRRYDTKWTKLNLGACIQQNNYGHRGEQGMFEAVGSRLFNLAGVESFKTTFLQFRIIDGVSEAGASQYDGDFWGLYLAVEQEDGRFLEEHGLPDGNFYKMESGTGELNNLGPLGPTDKSDLNYLLNNYTGATDDWWRTNWVLPDYYSYQAIVQAIHHYDINAGKNYFYYRHPDTGLWKVIPWDLDLTWAHNMYNSSWGGLNALASRILQATAEAGTGSQSGTSNLKLTGARPAFEMEFQNRVREIRDLLWNTDQTWQLIDECAALVRGPTNFPTFLDADRCQWDYNPRMADPAYSSSLNQAMQGRYYQWPYEPTVSKDFNGCIQLMKNYVVIRAEHLDSLAFDPVIPSQPTIAYIGPAGHPLNQLKFRCSTYSGADPFAAMQWRVGEVSDPAAPAYDPTGPKHYEITARWESPEITTFSSDIVIPAAAVKVGHVYRARARMKDTTGRWSNWSAPIQFLVGEPDTAGALVSRLRVTELMYHPPAGSDDEFIELHNISPDLALDLTGVNFTAGVDFTFTNGTTIPPGGYLIVTRNTNFAAFRARYGLAPSVPINGPYSGSLANDGETLTLKTGAGGTEIFSFTFGDGRGWPVPADGSGHSLVPVDPAAAGQATGALDYPGNWRASAFVNGSPGQADPEPPAPSVLLNEFAAHTDYFDPARPEYDSDDWIELDNPTGADVTLTNCYLSDDPASLKKWAIPAITIPARSWITFDEITHFHNPITTGFGLDKAGEQILLSYLPGTTEDRVVDAIAFKGQENERSLGRYPDGGRFWYAMSRTRDSANAAGLSGIVISEVMYHPPDFGTNDNTRDEFVELSNPTPYPITLEDTNGAWRLAGGVDFQFPAGTTVPSGESLLIVNFAPTNTATLEAFRAAHAITNLNLPIIGPYSGKLGNRSDRVALEKPQYPDLPGESYSWVIVDEVIYGNQAPWPTNANGAGQSLQRLSVARSGLDPENWIAAPATPGQATSDWDGDGMPNDWEIAHSLLPNDPGDAVRDADGDGFMNRQEYQAGTDPQDAASFLRFEAVTRNGADVILEFTAVSNRTYAIQFRDAVAACPWQDLTNVPAETFTRPVSLWYPLSPEATARFYRLITPAVP